MNWTNAIRALIIKNVYNRFGGKHHDLVVKYRSHCLLISWPEQAAGSDEENGYLGCALVIFGQMFKEGT